MNVDKESFASLMSLKEQLKVKQEEEARIAAEKEQKRKEAEAKAHEFENAMKELGVKKKIGREDKVFHAMPKPGTPFLVSDTPTKKRCSKTLCPTTSVSITFWIPMNGCLIGTFYGARCSQETGTRAHGPLKVPWIFTGTRSEEARLLLVEFLNEERKAGHRAVRIIHGQGFGSAGRKPVLKEKVPVWLAQRKEVLAFVQAPPYDGGAGAVYVLLAP